MIKKWKSAEHKRKAEQLASEWEAIKAKHGHPIKQTQTIRKAGSIGTKYTLGPPPGRSRNNHIPSASDTVSVAPKKEIMEYTGTKMVGIAIMHKSCLQPVFSADEAKDSAGMRR